MSRPHTQRFYFKLASNLRLLLVKPPQMFPIYNTKVRNHWFPNVHHLSESGGELF